MTGFPRLPRLCLVCRSPPPVPARVPGALPGFWVEWQGYITPRSSERHSHGSIPAHEFQGTGRVKHSPESCGSQRRPRPARSHQMLFWFRFSLITRCHSSPTGWHRMYYPVIMSEFKIRFGLHKYTSPGLSGSVQPWRLFYVTSFILQDLKSALKISSCLGWPWISLPFIWGEFGVKRKEFHKIKQRSSERKSQLHKVQMYLRSPYWEATPFGFWRSSCRTASTP